MNTGQIGAVMLCGKGVKACLACLRVKLRVSISDRFRKCIGIQRRFTNVHVYFIDFEKFTRGCRRVKPRCIWTDV